jgi:tetratricopeptide (TPR) repeat protein
LDIESLWDYTDPAESEARFREVLAGPKQYKRDMELEILTQIARTYSLRKRFDEAHAQLDEVWTHEKSMGAAPRVRYLLERGRTYNSSGDKVKARPLFVEAWQLGKDADLCGLAVDAAHMVAITYSGTDEMEKALDWNNNGIHLARWSEEDPKAQALIPAMLNNLAWDLHEMGRFADALTVFEEALEEYEKRGKVTAIQIAKWSKARCLRSLGLYDEALVMQYALEADYDAAGTPSGYVYEEIAENLIALGAPEDAAPYRKLATDYLGS